MHQIPEGMWYQDIDDGRRRMDRTISMVSQQKHDGKPIWVCGECGQWWPV